MLINIDDFQDLIELARESFTPPQEQGLPFSCMLALYYRAPMDKVYVGYFEGFKKLLTWLGMPVFGQDTIELDPIPIRLITWECQELAKILGASCKDIHYGYLGLVEKGITQ